MPRCDTNSSQNKPSRDSRFLPVTSLC